MKIKKLLIIIGFGVIMSFLFNQLPEQQLFVKIIVLITSFGFLYTFDFPTLLYALAFLIPYNLYFFDIIGQYTINFIQMLLLVTFIKFFILAKEKKFKVFPKLSLHILPFLGIVFISLLWTSEVLQGLKLALRWTLPATLLILGYNCDKEMRENIVKLMLISSSLLLVFGFIQYFGSKGLVNKMLDSKLMYIFIDHDRLRDETTNWFIWGGGIRSFGTFANANNFAAFLGFFLYLFLIKLRKFSIPFLVVFGLVILFTGSASGAIGFLISLCVFSFFQGKKIFEKISVPTFVIALFLLLLSTKILDIRTLKEIERRWSWRIGEWKYAAEFIAKNPLGVGLASYKKINPHNIFLLVGVNLGILGIGVFSWALAKIFQTGISCYIKGKEREITLAVLCGFLYFFIHSQADNIFIGDNIGMMFWLQTGFLAGIKK